jgi:hypothetical protein
MFLLYRAYTNSFSFFWISLFWVLDVEAWRNRDEFEQEVRKAIANGQLQRLLLQFLYRLMNPHFPLALPVQLIND